MNNLVSTRIRISTRLNFLFYFLIFCIVFVLVVFFRDYNSIDIGDSIEVLVIIFPISIILFLIRQLKVVEYDKNYLYIIKGIKEERILLKNIYKVSGTAIEIEGRYFWRICYYDDAGVIRAVWVIPKLLDTQFDKFKALVKTRNSEV